MQFFQILCFSAVIFTESVNAIGSCDRNTIHVAVNSTVFPYPVNVNCSSMTVKDLVVSKPSKSSLYTKYVVVNSYFSQELILWRKLNKEAYYLQHPQIY